VTPGWPHHLPGELVIALTGQAGFILARRRGLIDDGWRGHGSCRIVDAPSRAGARSASAS
jgi:hypothetical protein